MSFTATEVAAREAAANTRANDVETTREALMRASLSTPTDYTMSNFRSSAGREGEAFSGRINLNGRKIGEVRYDGGGGAYYFHFINRADEAAFDAEARRRFAPTADPDEYSEARDDFALELSERLSFNRKRCVVLIHDDLKVSFGDTIVFPARISLAQAKHFATTLVEFADKNPMLWDKRQSMFVPAADISA